MEALAPAQTIRYGGFWIRLLAWVIDFVVPSWAFGWILSQIGGDDFTVETMFTSQGQASFIVPVLAISSVMALHYILGPVLLGGTVGKFLLGYRIVDSEYHYIGPFRAIARSFAWLLSFLPLGLGFLYLAVSKDKRGFHDKLAGTFVVRKEWAQPTSLDARRLAAALALLLALVAAEGVLASTLMNGASQRLQPAVAAGDTFMSALRDEDLAAAYSVCHPLLQGQLKGAQGIETTLGLRAKGLRIAKWAHIGADVQTSPDGDTTTLSGTIVYADGSDGAFDMGLTKYGGEWRVSEFVYYIKQ